MRNLDPTSPREIPVEVKLLLQLERLVAGVRLPTASPGATEGP